MHENQHVLSIYLCVLVPWCFQFYGCPAWVISIFVNGNSDHIYTISCNPNLVAFAQNCIPLELDICLLHPDVTLGGKPFGFKGELTCPVCVCVYSLIGIEQCVGPDSDFALWA